MPVGRISCGETPSLESAAGVSVRRHPSRTAPAGHRGTRPGQCPAVRTTDDVGILEMQYEYRDDDRCQVRTGNTPLVLAGLRHTVISLLRMADETNIAAALRCRVVHPEEALRLLFEPP